MHALVLFSALTTTGLLGEAPQEPTVAPSSPAGAPIAAAPTQQPPTQLNAPVSPVMPVLPPAPFGVRYGYAPAGAVVDNGVIPAAVDLARTQSTLAPLPGAVVPPSVRVIAPAPYVVRSSAYYASMSFAQPVRRGWRGRRMWWTAPWMPMPYLAPAGMLPAVGIGPSVPPSLGSVGAS